MQFRKALAFDLAFSMTVFKAQGRTMDKVVIALTERSEKNLQMTYAGIFVGMSRVRSSKDMRLLLHLPNANHGNPAVAFSYIENLLPDKHIAIYNAGFNNQSGLWNKEESLKRSF